MTKLVHPDTHHLRAAQGWLELGDWSSANGELEEIAPEQRAHPDVLLLRVEVYMQAERWEYVVTVTETLVKMIPDNEQLWIHRSYALHELKRTQEAFDKLSPAADKFPDHWVIPYNLACYCAQRGTIRDAERYFKRALAINEDTVKRAAINDPDLKPLWDSMSGTIWKRE